MRMAAMTRKIFMEAGTEGTSEGVNQRKSE